MKILGIEKNSIAEELGIKAGDELLSFDGFRVVDVLDIEYYGAMDNFSMELKSGGELFEFDIEKDEDEQLGIVVEREIPVRQCCNNCIFCFVDQLPKEDLRSTLRVKDDDYRHSFISGNYVTLTNCTDADIDRIIRLRLSPLYISVHSVNHELRRKLLGCKKSNMPDIIDQLTRLKNAGIVMHAQIVYCPTFNEDYAQSARVLSGLCESLAIVPVGLTKNRNPAIVPVGKAEAERVIDAIEPLQSELKKKLGTRFVFIADEFYVKAGRDVPPYECYEDFGQIENGIGLIAAFLHDFDAAIDGLTGRIGHISVATGESAYRLIRSCADRLTARYGGTIDVYAVRNDFFGEGVTVTGLVVGRDIAAALHGKQLGERLIIPRTMLREFGDVFLDNMTVRELSERLGTKITVCGADGESFALSALNLPPKE